MSSLRSSRLARAARLLLFLPLLAGGSGCGSGADSLAGTSPDDHPEGPGCPPDIPDLSDPVADRLRDGGACFHLELEAGEALRLEVEQLDADLSISVEDPSGSTILIFDTPVGIEAPERPCIVASTTGRHLLRLKSLGAPDARYSLRRLVWRRATSEDSACATAALRFVEAGDRLLREGISEEAARSLEEAADLWSVAGDRLSESMARREAAWALESLGRFRQAEGQLRQALKAAREEANSYLELSSLNRLGLVLLSRAQIEAAAGAFHQALSGARDAGARRAEASALNNLALVDEIEGNLPKAIERLRRAARIQRGLPFPGDLARTLENLAANLALQDYHWEALDQLDKALDLARESSSADIEANCYLDIGWVHRLRGEPEKARAPIGEALRLWRSVGDLPGQATALDRLGTVLAESGEQTAALEAFQGSLKISREIESPMLQAPTLVNLACLHQELGNAETSRNLLLQVPIDTSHLLDSKARAHAHYCFAQLEEGTGNLPAALEHVEAALEIVEGMKSLSRRQGAWNRPIWLWQDYAELRVRLLVTLSEATANEDFLARAFSAADYARARSLFEMVLESQLPTDGPGADERVLRRRLQLLGESRRQLLAIEGPDADLKALEAELSEVVLELETTGARRRATEIGLLSLEAPARISISQVQALLPPGALLLRYFLTPRESYLFSADSDSLRVHRLPGRKVVEGHAEALHRALRQSSLNPHQAELLSLSTSRILLPEGLLESDIDSLLVVADGALHYVPFSALRVPEAGGPSPSSEDRLIDHLEVRYLPSAAVGVALDRRARARPPAAKSVAVFADSVYSVADGRLGPDAVDHPGDERTARLTPQQTLPRLEATAWEASSILRLLAPEERYAALGFEASKEALLDPRMAQYRILHLATHAFIDERFPELSRLVFSRYREDGEAVPGNLHLHEILGLRLNADLAVLSGCQTALGRRVRGDGLLGLTRGFFHAGCSQVLVSLWSVDDQATAALMAEFYRALLRDGQTAAASLRAAQAWMRSQELWREPVYWAPFVLQGVDSPPRIHDEFLPPSKNSARAATNGVAPGLGAISSEPPRSKLPREAKEEINDDQD